MMRRNWIRDGFLGAALALTPGCGGNGGTSATDGQTESGGTVGTTGVTDATAATAGTVGDGETDGSDAGTASNGMTSEPTTGTASVGDTSSGSTIHPPDTSTTDPGDTTGPIVDTTTDGETTVGDTTDGDTSGTTVACIPAVEVCNDVDDDCNGIVDDVDVGGDGICDCLSIALLGNQGANPSAQFQSWLEDQGTEVDRISLDATPLTPEILAEYDIIILDWLVRTYSPEEALIVEEWILGGGGLMSMTGHTNNNTVIDRPNSLLGPMGLAYNGGAGFFSGPVTNFAPHPINEGLTSVSFYGGLFVNITEDGIGDNEVIATLPQGPVGVVQERKNGKLFVWGDEWVEFDSEWQNIPEIKQFWVNTLAWLSPPKFCTIPQ